MKVFNGTVSSLARTLRVPMTRLYNAATRAGLKRFANEHELKVTALHMQQDAIPFTSLAELFGEDVTLAQLARLEQREHLVSKR